MSHSLLPLPIHRWVPFLETVTIHSYFLIGTKRPRDSVNVYICIHNTYIYFNLKVIALSMRAEYLKQLSPSILQILRSS